MMQKRSAGVLNMGIFSPKTEQGAVQFRELGAPGSLHFCTMNQSDATSAVAQRLGLND